MANCSICKGTGLLPFVKDGRVIPHAFVNCECKSETPEHEHPLSPEDIDFPVSYSYYRSLCQYHGWPDPGPDRLIEIEEETSPPNPQVVIHRHIHTYEKKAKGKY